MSWRRCGCSEAWYRRFSHRCQCWKSRAYRTAQCVSFFGCGAYRPQRRPVFCATPRKSEGHSMTCVCLCRVVLHVSFEASGGGDVALLSVSRHDPQTAVAACKGRDSTAVSSSRRRQGRLRQQLCSVGRLRSSGKRNAASCIVWDGVRDANMFLSGICFRPS